jgi:hypothetical protein
LIDPILDRTFGWLVGLGFVATRDDGATVGAAFTSDAVAVEANYHWHDEYADITIARSSRAEPAPYWAQVHLHELLEHSRFGASYNGKVRDVADLEAVFARGAELLRAVAADQLAGRSLGLLDDIIATRPHRGVPGLDYPTTEPWFASQEGLWLSTDFRGPVPIAEALQDSHSADSTERAIAALHLIPGLATSALEDEQAFDRLTQLLSDSDLNVRRAAASTLAMWRNPAVLDAVVELLDGEPGDAPSPFAATATFVAIFKRPEVRQLAREALDRFASRGPAASEQVALLRWRLEA